MSEQQTQPSIESLAALIPFTYSHCSICSTPLSIEWHPSAVAAFLATWCDCSGYRDPGPEDLASWEQVHRLAVGAGLEIPE